MICEAASSGPIEINLSHMDWQFKEQGGPDNWLPAAVPGTVHTDLFNAGKIPDLYYRNNEKELQWIGEKDWEYRTHFTVSKEVLEKDIVEMVFNGLDTYATIFINDYQVLSTENSTGPINWIASNGSTKGTTPCVSSSSRRLKLLKSSRKALISPKMTVTSTYASRPITLAGIGDPFI